MIKLSRLGGIRGTWDREEYEEADIPEGLEVGVCKSVSADNESRSISGVVFVGASLFLPASSRWRNTV